MTTDQQEQPAAAAAVATAAAREAPEGVCVFTPSPLYTVTIERGIGDEVPEIHFHAGGQGFWIARMVDCLGARAVLCAPLGGESGAVLRPLIEREGVQLAAIPVEGWNGGYVHDRRGGERRVLAEVASPRLSRHEVDDLYSTALAAALAAGVAVLTGAPNEGVLPADTYRRMPRDLGDNGVAVVADVSGEVLKAIGGGVRFLKVSHTELIEAGYCEGDSLEALLTGARHLKAGSGAGNLVVSRAHDPALALLGDDGRTVSFEGPRFQALDHRGAGDSMTAGLAVACARGLDPEDALRLAAAAGALNVTRHGLGSGQRHSIEEIARRVEVREVEG